VIVGKTTLQERATVLGVVIVLKAFS